MARKTGKKPTETLWVFCEGETEKKYFLKLQFEERVGRLRPKKASRQDAEGIVQDAVDFIKKSRDYVKGDAVACVFDRDANSDKQMNRAGRLANEHGIEMMFSNPAFEYWVLCHFGYFPSRYDRKGVLGMVEKKIANYEKGDPSLYLKIRPKQKDAVKNSRKIHDAHVKEKRNLLHEESNPLTLLFKLLKMVGRFS